MSVSQSGIQNCVNSSFGIQNHSVESVQCPKCINPRFFKGRRGLNVHLGKKHREESFESNFPLLSSNPSPFWQKIINLKNKCPLVKRIPRGARLSVASSFSVCIRRVISLNDVDSWLQFFSFSFRILHVNRGTETGTLTSKIKKNCVDIQNFNENAEIAFFGKRDFRNNLIRRVETKINDGDIKGAASLLFSDDKLAQNSKETLTELSSKHPLPSATHQIPGPPCPSDLTPKATDQDVLSAVMSFKNGSAGGLDGLTPQHFKDLLGSGTGAVGRTLLSDITRLVNLMLSGGVCSEVTEFLYGANLVALTKKGGGIRPIAVGNTIRRITSKVCCKKILTDLSAKFQPIQLGFGCKGGCEAAVHATRSFLCNNGSDVLLKVDVKNAFNSLSRVALLNNAQKYIPATYRYIWQCYSTPSKLFFGEDVINSSTGCQQGDPLGPAIFSLAIHDIITNLESKFNVWYLDDGTIGGEASSVLSDLKKIISEFSKIDLNLNFSKCELFIPQNFDSISRSKLISDFQLVAPDIKIVSNETLHLLGAPIFEESFETFVNNQIQKFQSHSENLKKLNPHIALFILKFCLFVPKLTYVLRCSPLWQHKNLLFSLDDLLRSTLSQILNCNFDDRSWSQATLPIRDGGLGIRQISSISLPAYLSSAHSNKNLFNMITNKIFGGNSDILYTSEAVHLWHLECPNVNLPLSVKIQKSWDEPMCKVLQENLLNSAANLADRARLLASFERESGYWLHAVPSANIGTLLDPTSFRFSVSLRLGVKVNEIHQCPCGSQVDQLGHHGLSCQRSAGRLSRHACLNDIIRRALVTINVPAVLEPNGIARDDGKRPDGMSLIPWQHGKSLVWDATCVDTLAPSHLHSTSRVAGAAATAGESSKRRKYAALGENYIFVPFAVETMGTWGSEAKKLFHQISSRLIECSGDNKAGFYLGQRISLAIQRGNVASLVGTMPQGNDLSQVFYLV